MSEQPVDPNEHDEHDQPAKEHGDQLEEVVTETNERITNLTILVDRLVAKDLGS